MDAIDEAAEREQQHRDAILAARRAEQEKPSEHYCTDCAEEIPEMRREIPGVTRCVECQSMYEAREARK